MDFSTLFPWLAAAVTTVIVVYVLFNFYSAKEWENIQVSDRRGPYGSPGTLIFAVVLLPVVVFFLASPNFKFKADYSIKNGPAQTATAPEVTKAAKAPSRGDRNMLFVGVFCLIAVVGGAFGLISRSYSKATAHGDVLVQNLPEEVGREELAELFSQSGKVLAVQFREAKNGERKQNIAIVKMAKSEDAHSAMIMFNGQSMHGQTIFVEHTKV